MHANIIDAILQGDFLVRPKAAVLYEFSAIVLFGLLSTILFVRYKAVANLTFLFLFALVAVTLPVFLFRNGIYLSPLYPLLADTSNFSLLSFLDYWHGESLLKEKTRLQLATQEAMIETIANITETRDSETGGHIRRTRSYVKTLAEHIRNKPAYADTVTVAYIDYLFQAAPLHDLGKGGDTGSHSAKSRATHHRRLEAIKKHRSMAKESSMPHRLNSEIYPV